MAVERGYSSALEHAIRCGELLILQKETVTATAKWGPWREEHLPNIPQTTASLYMRLAENKEVIQKNQQRVAKEVVKDGNRSLMSIRHAISLLPKKPPTQKQIEAAEKRKAEAAAKKAEGTTPRAKEEQIGKGYLKSLEAPDELVTVLEEVFDTDYLKDLVAKLTKALRPE